MLGLAKRDCFTGSLVGSATVLLLCRMVNQPTRMHAHRNHFGGKVKASLKGKDFSGGKEHGEQNPGRFNGF